MNQDRAPDIQLAERLADRLCHDILSTSQALASGLDLLGEASTEAARKEALQFLNEGLAAQRSRVVFSRRAFGPGVGSTSDELQNLVEGLFDGLRASVEWTAGSLDLGPVAERVVLNLSQIAAEALALGGVARVNCRAVGGEVMIEVDAIAPRLTSREETRAGLNGQPFANGIGARWVQGAYVYALAAQAGGTLTVEPRETLIRFTVALPAGA